MNITISDKYYLTGLTDPELSSIKKQLTINNPKYLEALKLGRKAFGIEKQIHLFDKTEDGLSIPRGA